MKLKLLTVWCKDYDKEIFKCKKQQFYKQELNVIFIKYLLFKVFTALLIT